MAKILDYSFARPDPNTIKAAGFAGVIRYLAPSSTGSKVLTKPEVDSLQSVGLAIGLVWEWYSDRALGGSAAGIADAQAALQQANDLGVPSSVPIFFAVDFDATPEQQQSIIVYFNAINSIIGKERTGIYGGFWPVSRSFDAGVVSWGWQTYAWSGTNIDPRAQLLQTQNGQWNNQVDFDEDKQGLAGLWLPNEGGTEMPMNKDDVMAMCQARGFTPSDAEVTKWTDPKQFPTFKDAEYDICKQYPIDVINTPKSTAAQQQIDQLSQQLNDMKVESSLTEVELQNNLDNARNQVVALQKQLASSDNSVFSNMFQFLGKYNKIYIAAIGLVLTALANHLGTDNIIVQEAMLAGTALGVHITPNTTKN